MQKKGFCRSDRENLAKKISDLRQLGGTHATARSSSVRKWKELARNSTSKIRSRIRSTAVWTMDLRFLFGASWSRNQSLGSRRRLCVCAGCWLNNGLESNLSRTGFCVNRNLPIQRENGKFTFQLSAEKQPIERLVALSKNQNCSAFFRGAIFMCHVV
jgi:hypothetical protein